MTFRTLIRRSLRFHARAHFGVALGAAIGSAALIGALVIGDCVSVTLRNRALQRLANAHFALASQEGTFSHDPVRFEPLLQINPARPNQAVILQPFIPRGSAAGEKLSPWSTKLLSLSGTASLPSGTARANHVEVYGMDADSWEFVGATGFATVPTNSLMLNKSLATQLGARNGDEVILRVNRPGALSREAAVAPRANQSAVLRLKVAGVLPAGFGGDLELRVASAPPLNVFVPLDLLSTAAGLTNSANLCFVGAVGKASPRLPSGTTGLGRWFADAKRYWYRLLLRRSYRAQDEAASTEESLHFLSDQFQKHWTLKDAELELKYGPDPFGLELRSPRVFLEPSVLAAAERIEGTNCVFISTYLANLISVGTNATPYSMVTAAGPPYTPADMKDDEVIVTKWLADDLGAVPGDRLSLSYFDPESGGKLSEQTNTFRVLSVVSNQPPWSDRTLMPDFPGIEKAESTRDWDAGFPLVHKIRPKDEDYWKKYRGTPKAFLTLGAGKKLWANRFGSLTAIRFRNTPGMPTAEHWGRFKDKLLATLKPGELGLRFDPVRDQALKAAEQSQDFGQLFLGFSIFLVVAALLLMALLFQFALEQRTSEIGTMLALGFTVRQVRRMLLLEGATLAALGGILGAGAGLLYAKGMLWGLATIWRNAVGNAALEFHVTLPSVVIGFLASTLVSSLTIWFALRKQARQPAVQLLAGQAQSPKIKAKSYAIWIGLPAAFAAIGVITYGFLSRGGADPETFFTAGALLLVTGLAIAAFWLGVLARQTAAAHFTFGGLALRSCSRRRSRSLATIALLACGCFVIVAIGAFRLDANRDAAQPKSGTGGFALIGQSTIPTAQDLNSKPGQEFFGLSPGDLAGISFVPLRVREGDEASCLNLNRAQTPRLLGVRPERLGGRFLFSSAAKGLDVRAAWDLLKTGAHGDEVAAVGDANSIQWALGKKLGDTLDYTDEQGHPFKLRLVAAVANSILQGNLLIDEAEFLKRFPSESGYRMFLIDAPTNKVAQVSATLSRALEDVGLELTPTVQRLNAFNAVQNTYLGTFQVLGGLGLFLGSAGLGVVVLRNALERRGELALLAAVGFRHRSLQWLVLSEHGALLAVGLATGIISAAIAVLPALLSPGSQLPYASLALTLAAVLLNGTLWTWGATRYALRGNLLDALRNE